MNTQLQTSAENEQEFFHAPEMAKWQGIPLRTFLKFTADGLIPSYKLGRHRLYRKSEVLDALARNRTASTSEVLR